MAQPPRADVLFEVSWEVCNKVGGIHTVIRSKAPFITRSYPEYYLIGPAQGLQDQQFQPATPPQALRDVFAAVRTQGIVCHFGTWLVPGEPHVILLDFQGVVPRKDELKFLLWQRFGIDSMGARWDFDEPLCFSIAAGMVVEEYLRRSKVKAVLQCHEWMTGFALLYCKAAGVPVATVFTTHATMLGRSMAGNGQPLYAMLDTLDPRAWAYRLNVQEKHLTEVACATHAHVFTTVSDVTGRESERLLGRKPDVLLLNGFHADKFPTFEETSVRHNQSRDELRELVAYTFFPYYTFNIDRTFLLYTSGRYEFGNKGMDVLLEALAQVNARLKAAHSDRTVVAFFWVLRDRGPVRRELLENKNFYQHVKSYVSWQSRTLVHKLVLDLLAGKRPGQDDMQSVDFMQRIHADIRRFHRTGVPPMVTHEIPDEQHDPILTTCGRLGLRNEESDPVKVLLYPGDLDGSDGLLNLPYYDAAIGTHLGVFPSAYEPWGYTPLESAALGVPTITTDTAGFGAYLQAEGRATDRGVQILPRWNATRDAVIAALTDRLYAFITMDHLERVQQGMAAKSVSMLCDWEHFIARYLEAHNLALDRV